MRKSALLLSTTLTLGLGQAGLAADWDALTHAGGQSANWLVYGGNLANTRYVPNDEINVDNVGDLELKWIFQTGIIGSFENTPVVEDGVMYITTPYNHVFAIDARTGRELWHYEHKLGTTIFCCGPNNRGVALADDKVYMATLDAMLIALDKRTGELAWETEIADPESGYSETVAPTVYQDKIILGISGAEYGIRGFISAYNKDSGELVWRWHTIPEPDEVLPDGTKGWYGNFAEKADGINPLNRDIAAEKAAIESGEHDDAWQRGGGSNWMTNAIDPERGVVYATIGNPSPDLYADIRPGDNRWTESLVALNAETGELIWGYQYVPHDPWDLDAVSPPILAEVQGANGGMVPGVIHGGKTGWVYVHDAETRQVAAPLGEHDPAREPVHAADRGGHPHAAGCQWRRRVVAGRVQSGHPHGLLRQPAPADDLYRRKGGVGAAERRPEEAGSFSRAGATLAGRRLRRDSGRGPVGQRFRGQRRHRRDRVAGQDRGSDDRRRADHRRQPGVRGRGRRQLQRLRRDDRRQALVVPGRRRGQLGADGV